MAGAALPIAIGVGMLASTAGSMVASQQQKETADENLDFQKEQFEYEKDMQQKIMDREDTAIQRQRNDSLAAGISPLAGMTGSESSGAAGIAVNTPQKQNTTPPLAQLLTGIGTLSSMVDLVAKVQNMNASTDYVQSQTVGRDQANAFDWATIDERIQQTQLQNLLSREDLSSKQLQGKFDAETYQDRVNAVKLSNMILKQNYDFDNQSFADRLSGIRISNSLAGEDLSAKKLANTYSRRTLADRIATVNTQNRILSEQLADTQRELEFRQHYGLFNSAPKGLQEAVTKGTYSFVDGVMNSLEDIFGLKKRKR